MHHLELEMDLNSYTYTPTHTHIKVYKIFIKWKQFSLKTMYMNRNISINAQKKSNVKFHLLFLDFMQ